MILRTYQKECLDALNKFFLNGKTRGLVSLPCGTGKTFMMAKLIEKYFAEGNVLPVLSIAHVDELLENAIQHFAELLPDKIIGKEKANDYSSKESKIVVASIQTIGREDCTRLDDREFGMILFDEAQHTAAESYLRIKNKFGKNALIVGLTATEVRADKKELIGEIFEELVYKYPISRAIQEGFIPDILCQRIYTDVNIDSARFNGEGFDPSDLEKIYSASNRDEIIYEAWKEYAHNKQTLIFAAGLEHSKKLVQFFTSKGVSIQHVDGTTPKLERQQIFEDINSKKLTILTNYRIAQEGVNIPSIECIIMACPTTSWGLYTQEVGRGTRLYKDKEQLVVIDITDNCKKHKLCSLPSMVGLPSSIDMSGMTVKEVLSLTQDPRILRVLNKQNPKSIEEARLLAEKVNLLTSSEIQINKDLNYFWIDLSNDSYLLPLPSEKEVLIEYDESGHYVGKLVDKGVLVHKVTSQFLDKALELAETAAEKFFPKDINLFRRGSKWFNEPATPNQKRLLTNLKQDYSIYLDLTKSQACILINLAYRKGFKPKPIPAWVLKKKG